MDRHDAAISDLDRGLELARGSRRTDLRVLRAMALVKVGDHAQAAREANDLSEHEALSPTASYNLACVLALSSAAAGRDAQIPEDGQAVEQYAARAIELLHQARTAGFFQTSANVELLNTDPDLKPLRSRDDFQKLQADLAKQYGTEPE